MCEGVSNWCILTALFSTREVSFHRKIVPGRWRISWLRGRDTDPVIDVPTPGRHRALIHFQFTFVVKLTRIRSKDNKLQRRDITHITTNGSFVFSVLTRHPLIFASANEGRTSRK